MKNFIKYIVIVLVLVLSSTSVFAQRKINQPSSVDKLKTELSGSVGANGIDNSKYSKTTYESVTNTQTGQTDIYKTVTSRANLRFFGQLEGGINGSSKPIGVATFGLKYKPFKFGVSIFNENSKLENSDNNKVYAKGFGGRFETGLDIVNLFYPRKTQHSLYVLGRVGYVKMDKFEKFDFKFEDENGQFDGTINLKPDGSSLTYGFGLEYNFRLSNDPSKNASRFYIGAKFMMDYYKGAYKNGGFNGQGAFKGSADKFAPSGLFTIGIDFGKTSKTSGKIN